MESHHPVQKDARPLHLLLCVRALRGVYRHRSVLRMGPDRQRRREAAVHHHGLHRLRPDDSAGIDVDKGLDPAARPEVAAAPSPHLYNRRLRRHSLLVEGQGDDWLAGLLCGDYWCFAGIPAPLVIARVQAVENTTGYGLSAIL